MNGGDVPARLVAVVLNWRTALQAIDCARSLAPELDPTCDRLVVVDNDSGDGSAAALRAALPTAVVIESGRNGGFAFGHNTALRAFAAESYLLVNSDTLIRPGAVARLRARLVADPRLAVVTPRLEDRAGQPQSSCFRFHSPLTELLHAASTGPLTRLCGGREVALPPRDAPEEPDWTSFACVLVRGAALADVGLLDEGFFMYYEDVDFCRRARARGWRIASEPAARVVHFGAASTGLHALEAQRQRRPRYFYAARARYFRKHHGRLGLLAANLAWTAGRALSRARELFGRKRPHTVAGELLDRWRG